MSTPTQIAARAATARRRALIVATVVLVLLAVGVGWYLGRSTSGSGASGEEASPSASPNPLADPDSFVPEGGQRLADGQYPVGFSHSPEGAASAAIAAVRALSTNDEGVLADVMSLYYEGEYTSEQVEEFFFPQRAEEIAFSLQDDPAFNPEAFPAPESYYYITPIGVRWEQVDADSVNVLVLAQEEASDGEGLAFERPYIYGRQLRWDGQVRGGDWVIAGARDPSDEHLYVYDEYNYTLDNPDWTPIAFPEFEEGE